MWRAVEKQKVKCYQTCIVVADFHWKESCKISFIGRHCEVVF
jgi:hypothetical protein